MLCVDNLFYVGGIWIGRRIKYFFMGCISSQNQRLGKMFSRRSTSLPPTHTRFVIVNWPHKLCRNVHSHNSCGNASGISPSYKCCGNAVCHFLNHVQECQNIAFILRMVFTAFLSFNDAKSL